MPSSLWACLVASTAFAAGAGGPGDGCPIDKSSVIDENDLTDVEAVKDSPYYEMARSVARVENYSRDGFCTAVRIGATLFMTNFHCWENAGCRVRFRLGYERRMPAGGQALFDCVEALQRAPELDFVVYRVRPVYAQQPDFPVATLSRKPVDLGELLIAPGHPVLKPKQIDVSSACRITRAEPYEHEAVLSIQHQCDTEGGSSGTPLIDRTTGHVVGLHWGSAGDTGANHAVPMNLILDRIHEMDPLLYAELTVAED